MRRQGPARVVNLSCEVAPAVVHADADRLEQVFANLIDNAVAYGGAAWVTLENGA